MMPSSSRRPRGIFRWIALPLIAVLATGGFWYHSMRSGLICADDAAATWKLTYTDGPGISKFMWAIQPADQAGFIDCLKRNGYDIANTPSSGKITATDTYDRTISNTAGDNFVQTGTFYKW